MRVYAGRHPETGRVRHVSRTTTKGIKDARAIRARLQTEVADGLHGTASGDTFGSLLDSWLKDGRQGRAATTLHAYRQAIDTSIRPALGSITLSDLTARHLDAFYSERIAAGTSPARVMQFHRIISAALSQAEKWDLVPGNVARKASPPQVPKKAQQTPPRSRVRALIDAAETSGTPELATVITLAAMTGMRRGELCGLRWSDIDWRESALTVRHAIWETPGGNWGMKDPKSHQIRHLVLGEHTMAVLEGRWQRATSAASIAEIELSEDAYVFSPAVDGLRPMRPGNVTLAFGRLCRRMEQPAKDKAAAGGKLVKPSELWQYRFHDLRRYTATELLRAGHNARTVSDRLGHAEPGFTLRVYAGGTTDQAVAAAASLEAGLAG